MGSTFVTVTDIFTGLYMRSLRYEVYVNGDRRIHDTVSDRNGLNFTLNTFMLIIYIAIGIME
jgi:hypothetical protein